MTCGPEPVRAIHVPGTWGYVGQINALPGANVTFHLSCPAAFDFSVVRLGTTAILDATADDRALRADVELLYQCHHAEATPHAIHPGSYVYIGGAPIPAGPLTLASWVRLWRLPVNDTVQWQWGGVITDLDYPDACRFGLLIDHAGRVGVYAGDGGVFRHEWLHRTEPLLGRRLGQWVHLAASVDQDGVLIRVDGELVYRRAEAQPVAPPGRRARLRLGASAERGAADNFLDGDLAVPFVGGFAMRDPEARRLVEDRGRTGVRSLVQGIMLGCWPLDEERGVTVADHSGHGRHGQIVNHGTWNIGGPAHDASKGVLEYDPRADPDRGHGLRLSSDDLVDCGWAVTETFQIPADAPSGLYAGRVCLVGQDPATALAIPFVVVRLHPRTPPALALQCATNTWYAYGRRPLDAMPVAGLSSSFYSVHRSGRPFFHVGTRVPIPRASPYAYDSPRAAYVRHAQLVRPEWYAQAWLSREGYPFECLTDSDVHADPDVLRAFAAVLIPGHSEYWSDTMRDALLSYLRAGGRALVLSGDTMSQRITFNDDLSVLESRKIVTTDDERWLPPSRWGERWHSDDQRPGGRFRSIGRPPYQVTGLTTQGMIDDGTPSSFAPFTVVNPGHFLFHRPERVPLSPQGTIGEHCLNGPKASGYEFDASPETVGLTADPMPGVVKLASAIGQRNLEWIGTNPSHGGDITYWERPDGGTVVHAGSIAVTGALAVDDGLQVLIRNVLHHFGIPRRRRPTRAP